MIIWVEKKSKMATWISHAIAGALEKVVVFDVEEYLRKLSPAELKAFLESMSGQGVDVITLYNDWKRFRQEGELLIGDSDPKIKGLFVPVDEGEKERTGDKVVEDVLQVLREQKFIRGR